MTTINPLTLCMLVMTPIMVALGQVMFKMTGHRLAEAGDAPFYSIAWNPIFLAAIALYGGATLAWVYVLKSVPLAYAYSFMALTFVAVPLLAALWLDEPLTLKYALGLGLIVAGLLVVQT